MVYVQKTDGQRIPKSADESQVVQTPCNHGKLIQNGQNKGRIRVPRARKPLYSVFWPLFPAMAQISNFAQILVAQNGKIIKKFVSFLRMWLFENFKKQKGVKKYSLYNYGFSFSEFPEKSRNFQKISKIFAFPKNRHNFFHAASWGLKFLWKISIF